MLQLQTVKKNTTYPSDALLENCPHTETASREHWNWQTTPNTCQHTTICDSSSELRCLGSFYVLCVCTLTIHTSMQHADATLKKNL